MRVLIIDGQGGGIGRALVEKAKAVLPAEAELIALGTNALATQAMMKAGASLAATGENAILYNAPRADIILGSIGIIAAHSMLGELTPAMAQAIAASPAVKILIPLNRCNLHIVGVQGAALPLQIEEAIQTLCRQINAAKS